MCLWPWSMQKNYPWITALSSFWPHPEPGFHYKSHHISWEWPGLSHPEWLLLDSFPSSSPCLDRMGWELVSVYHLSLHFIPDLLSTSNLAVLAQFLPLTCPLHLIHGPALNLLRLYPSASLLIFFTWLVDAGPMCTKENFFIFHFRKWGEVGF